VTDVVKGIISLTNHPDAVGEVFNIGSDKEITIENLAIKIKQMTNSRSEIQYILYDKAYEKGFEDMRHRKPDLTKIKSLIGYEPKVKLEEALIKIIEYFKNYQTS